MFMAILYRTKRENVNGRHMPVITAILNENDTFTKRRSNIARQLGYCMGGNFNIHIWAWSASPSVQVGRL